jgi:hypothetical protein
MFYKKNTFKPRESNDCGVFLLIHMANVNHDRTFVVK